MIMLLGLILGSALTIVIMSCMTAGKIEDLQHEIATLEYELNNLRGDLNG